jgi:hypothetical protein
MGIVLGVLLPLIVFLLIYLVRFNESTLSEFLKTFAAQKGLITFFGVWCLVSNIALFTYYVNTAKDRTAKGIFAVTLLYGIGILIAKVLI